MRRSLIVVALLCALSVAAPALAGAAASGTPAQAINDCNDHLRLTGHYSSQVLRQALAQMPADVREYTNCFDVIERQLFKQLGNGSSTPATATSSGSSFIPTWLIVVIVLLALAAITFGALAIRRRGAPADGDEPGGPGGPGGPGSKAGGPGAPGGPGPEAGGPDGPGSEPGGPSGPPAT